MTNNSGSSSQQAFALGRPSSPPKAFAQALPPPTVSPGSIKVKLPGSQQATAALFQRPIETQRTQTTSQRAESVLKSLYESGEYSDLTVVTGEATYKVHKNIVLPASAWLEDAFQTQGARIQITIAPEAVNSMFCHLYAAEVPILVPAKPFLGLAPAQSAQGFGTGPVATDEAASKDLCSVVELISASELWGLSDLAAQATDVLVTKLQLYESFPEAIAYTASMMYCIKSRLTVENNTINEAASAAVKAVVKVLKSVMSNEAAEKHLFENPGLTRAVLALTAEGTSTGFKRGGEPLESERRKK